MEGHDIKQVGVTVNLDKERRLVFDLNALCELEEKYGSIDKGMKELQKGSLKAIRYMLYLGLLNEDESMTEKKVGKLITMQNIKEVMQAITTSVTNSTPKPEKN